MVSSLEPSSLYWQVMALYREALKRAGLLPQAEARMQKKPVQLSQAARVFTAATNVAELANAADPSAVASLTLAEIALLSHILTQIGPYGHEPSDLKGQIAELANQLTAVVPKLAGSIAEQLKSM